MAPGHAAADAFDMRHLTALGWLGDGAFGVVWRVRHKPSGEACALKCVERSRLRRPQDADGVLRERQILGLLAQREHAHALIVRAAAFFRGHLDDREGLYMLLELMSGGDLEKRPARAAALLTAIVLRLLCRVRAPRYSIARLGHCVPRLEAGEFGHRPLWLFEADRLRIVQSALVVRRRPDVDIMRTPHFMAPEIIRGRGLWHLPLIGGRWASSPMRC